VVCDRCGASASVLKTCRWRSGSGRTFVLCDGCHAPISGAVWIVPGRVPAHGFCSGCSEWFSVRDLVELRSGGWKWDSPSGLCPECAE
jgi:hypothetical protein